MEAALGSSVSSAACHFDAVAQILRPDPVGLRNAVQSTTDNVAKQFQFFGGLDIPLGEHALWKAAAEGTVTVKKESSGCKWETLRWVPEQPWLDSVTRSSKMMIMRSNVPAPFLCDLDFAALTENT